MCNIIAEESMRKELGKHFDFNRVAGHLHSSSSTARIVCCNKLKDAKCNEKEPMPSERQKRTAMKEKPLSHHRKTVRHQKKKTQDCNSMHSVFRSRLYTHIARPRQTCSETFTIRQQTVRSVPVHLIGMAVLCAPFEFDTTIFREKKSHTATKTLPCVSNACSFSHTHALRLPQTQSTRSMVMVL